MKILYDNLIKNSTITSSTETSLYDDDFIVDINSKKTWRSTVDTASSVVFELASADSFDSVGIVNHNFTDAATIKIQANATDSWGAPTFTTTLTWRDYIIHESFTAPANLLFWRIEVTDAANPDGYIEIGTLYLGNELDMPGMTPTQTLGFNTNSIVSFSTSNQPFGDIRDNYNTVGVEVPIKTNTQRKAIRAMFNTIKNITPMFMSIWEDDQDFEDPYYCVLDKAEQSATKDENGNFTMSLDFREVK